MKEDDRASVVIGKDPRRFAGLAIRTPAPQPAVPLRTLPDRSAANDRIKGSSPP